MKNVFNHFFSPLAPGLRTGKYIAQVLGSFPELAGFRLAGSQAGLKFDRFFVQPFQVFAHGFQPSIDQLFLGVELGLTGFCLGGQGSLGQLEEFLRTFLQRMER